MIRVPQVRVIDDEGEQLGIMKPEEAMRIADGKGLDLVEVAPNAQPPVCRMIDYGKYRYQQSKRIKEAKKNQHIVVVKEIKYRPKISNHDFDFKTNHVKEFLQAGNKVKLTIMFRGRELAHPEFGKDLLQRVLDALEGHASDIPDLNRTRLEGRNMSIVLSPLKH
jgi:translation initiation factor IF-3